MDERLIDANVLLRHFTGDNTAQSPAATALLQLVARGEEQVWTTPLVVAEVVWVLSGPVYGATRTDIATKLTEFIQRSGVRVVDAGILVDALTLFAEQPRLSFIDAFLGVLALRSPGQGIFSWDRDFDRIPGVRRIEPPSPAL